MTDYRYLLPGEEILVGDEFKRIDGTWITLCSVDKDAWEKQTGKPLIRGKKDLAVRRKIKPTIIAKGLFL